MDLLVALQGPVVIPSTGCSCAFKHEGQLAYSFVEILDLKAHLLPLGLVEFEYLLRIVSIFEAFNLSLESRDR